MLDRVAELVATYGYALVFLMVGIESFGIPLPGETALLTAAAYAALGRLNIYGVVIAAAAGAIVGDNAGYWLGRRGGLTLIRRYGKHVGLSPSRLEQLQRFFDRHGARTVFIGRFVAMMRSWTAALAGVARMPYRSFSAYNAMGGITWASTYGALGYLFGRNLPLLERYVGRASLVVAACVAILLVILVRRRGAARRGA